MNGLKKRSIWVCWKHDPSHGKIPINPKTGGNAQSNNPKTWATYEQATAAAAKHQYDGVGFMFADGLCGIDIDNIKNNPERERQAKEIVAHMNTYTEYSPSGNGCHIIFRCDPAKIPQVNGKLDPAYYQKNPHSGIECYMSGLTNRFFTYTGKAINNFDVEERTEKLLIFLDEHMKKINPPPRANVTGGFKNGHVPNAQDIINVAQKAKNGKEFLDLFKNGDTSKYNNDDSVADITLCNILAFWCGNNPP